MKFQSKLDLVGNCQKNADEDQIPKETIPVKKGMIYEVKWGEIVID